MNMINKFEIVLRKIHNNLIATGVMLTNDLTAGDVSGYEMYGEKTGDNTCLIHVRKASFLPKNEYGETFEKYSLSELPTNGIWRRFESDKANLFGGVIVGRDNQKFENEPTDLNRMAVVSVIEDKAKLVPTDGHYMFRSTNAVESNEFITFFMERDLTTSTATLLVALQGEALMSFYRKPFWSDLTGQPYRLKSDLALKGISLHKQQYSDLVHFGSVQPETKEIMRAHWLNVNDESEYVDFVQALSAETDLPFQHFDRLLSESEHEVISAAVKRITQNQYPQSVK
ncbi:hypothetical protein D6V10_07825 [Vibrio cholerae]|nr:hypothetical protein [Vibrio cholerae]